MMDVVLFLCKKNSCQIFELPIRQLFNATKMRHHLWKKKHKVLNRMF